tara:strand:- start:6222 stop:6434 length:213 start_codon:yes stop_codon:yes gene_type:complete
MNRISIPQGLARDLLDVLADYSQTREAVLEATHEDMTPEAFEEHVANLATAEAAWVMIEDLLATAEEGAQ